jgi:hypothetical protein
MNHLPNRRRPARRANAPARHAATPDETGPTRLSSYRAPRQGVPCSRTDPAHNLPAKDVKTTDYRGAQQILPGSPTRIPSGGPSSRLGNPRKQAENAPLPARPQHTGVPNKHYRGAQQALPGSPTNTTGVPNKYYRGPQQILPGCPTNITGVPNKSPFQEVLQNGVFCLRFLASLVFVFVVSVMFKNNNYREDGEVCLWGPTKSS